MRQEQAIGALSILMLTDALHSDAPGGSRRVVQELAGGLVARGNRVTLVAPRQRGDEPPCRDQDGIRVYRYGNGGKGMRALPKLLTEERQALTALVRDAAGYPFDILNVHFSYFHLPALLPFSSRLAPVTVRSFYGPWAAEGLVEQAPRRARDPRSAGAWARFKARSSIEQRSLDRSDHIIALSDHSIRELTDLYNVPREKISLVPGGVVPPHGSVLMRPSPLVGARGGRGRGGDDYDHASDRAAVCG